MVVGDMNLNTELLVIGSGPGGYAAAFRAADLGLDVTLVDPTVKPGGTCLFEGCIPSKTLLFLAELIHDAGRAAEMGVDFGPPRIDLQKIRTWKNTVIQNMAQGLVSLADKRGVQLISGKARFEDSRCVRLAESEITKINFKKAVIATGSVPLSLPGISYQPEGRIMHSGTALNFVDIPQTLLIVGGGYIGLELGMVYSALGSRITLVEREDRLLPGVDKDLVEPLQRRLEQEFDSIGLNTKISNVQEQDQNVAVQLEKDNTTVDRTFERLLIAVGRSPASSDLGLEHTRVRCDQRGFIVVDEQQRTSDEAIFAVGDVVGGMMLAHKATREGKVAAEVIAGQKSAFDARAIPAVVYTDPQIAWCGITEEQAKKRDIAVSVQKFPWKYSGRAQTMGATEGFTKLLTNPSDGRILGVGITGRNTEGLIAEGVLAIEMGALAEDLALSLHPHPTLSETESEAAELYLGSATHLLSRKTPTRT